MSVAGIQTGESIEPLRANGPGERIRDVALEVLDLVLPMECVGCGRDGRMVCPMCRRRLAPRVRRRTVGRGLSVWSGLEYESVAQKALLAFKNAGRTDLARPLSIALLAAAAAALESEVLIRADDAGADARIALVPMPRTRRSSRERGYDPVRLLLRRAKLPADPWLSLDRRGADQASLGRDARFVNADHSMRAASAVHGQLVLLVDDVVTTGATLAEAARAVSAAGGHVLGAITVASTPLYGSARR